MPTPAIAPPKGPLTVSDWSRSACQTAQVSLTKIPLEGRLTVIAGPNPPSDSGFCSDRLQVLHWRVDEPYSNVGTHLHRESDEVYVVLEGAIDLDVNGSLVTVSAGEAIAVGAGVSHALVAVQPPGSWPDDSWSRDQRQGDHRLTLPLRASRPTLVCGRYATTLRRPP